ncbi:hypothetical protein GB928_028095 [Shinella curvata]|uniref:Uncharacterized protein n=1 Tax=Shinella curvata TaxID=1817964 RepID=A0ABT8XMS7_9HYPH|nr:hypothetical protein [Shinella curvata]MCJ8057271.1 hypothetical protein [Shinella curvata]MDO6125051.1 hypothetical protein [Shinella curvata]
MPLNTKNGATAPKELGLFWPMQTLEGKTMDVYVYASTLQWFDADPVGPVGLLKRHRALLETIASEKFDRCNPADGGPIHISEEDLHGARTTDGGVDDDE